MTLDAEFASQKCALPCNFGGASDVGSVKYTPQALPPEKQAQARENIGAADGSQVLLHTEQALTLEQQYQARQNIGAADANTDHIVEQGKIHSWDYRKWASGVAECWRTVTATVKTTDWKDSGMMSIPLLSGLGLFWTKDVKIQLAYPFTFASRPVETACMTNGTVWFPLSLISTTGKQLDRTDSYRICTYKAPEQDIEVTVSFHVMGRWKN